MDKRIIIIGGGGHAKVVIDCIRACGDMPEGILDDRLPVGSCVLGVNVLGSTDIWQEYADREFMIAVGNNAIRQKIAEKMTVRFYTAIHPRATVAASAQIGAGTLVCAGAVINPDARVGQHCIVNTLSAVEHDCVLADGVHISPRAALGGTVSVGERTHIGIGATVRNNLAICGDCVVGAGAVVVKDIVKPGVYVGIPAVCKEKDGL